MDNKRIFEFLHAKLAGGQECVLVTVIAVDGSSMRDPGAHMGVCADGCFAGSLSGGCIENAIVAEALGVLNEGKPRVVRFGAGSSYIDIKLPCGGGLDIHFLPLTDAAFVGACMKAITKREPFSLHLPMKSGSAECVTGYRSLAADAVLEQVTIGHWPAPKLLIIGHGAAVSSLCKLANSMDIEVSILTSDPALAQQLSEATSDTQTLSSAREVNGLNSDPWTAIIFLFHDHDWESHLMQRALSLPHFYIGAMGGRKAHAFRSGNLRALGVTQTEIDSIKAPIGLFHSSRDPDSLALSALAQVIECYQSSDFGAGK